MNQYDYAQVVPAYLRQLSNDFEMSQTDNGCFVLTPFLRPDGEAIQLQVETGPDGNVRLSDMGDSLGYLYVNGLTLSNSVMESAQRISRGFGVTLSRNELSVESDDQAVGDALHRLIQAALAVTELIHK